MTLKDAKGFAEHGERGSIDPVASGLSKYLEDRKIDLEEQEPLSMDAANSLMSKLRAQLEPFRPLIDQASPWEEKSAAIRLSDKMLKCKRNKLWRKRKRKRVAEMRAKVLLIFIHLLSAAGLILFSVSCLVCPICLL